MAGENGDSGDGNLPEDPNFFPKFDIDFDPVFDLDNSFGFSNIVHPDQHAGNSVDGGNPSGNHIDGYLPLSPDFFVDLPSDEENVFTESEPHHSLQSEEQVAGNLVKNVNTNENYCAAHNDVEYVPEEPDPSRLIHSGHRNSIDEFEFAHTKEYDSDTIMEDANPSENIDNSSQEQIKEEHHANVTGDFGSSEHHAAGFFYQNLQDYPSLEHVPLETHFHGIELDVGSFAGNTNYPSQEHVIKEHNVEETVAGEFASSQLQGSENDVIRNERERWPGWPGQNVFRLLVPVSKIPLLIGRKGEHIRRISEDTKARIKIIDAPTLYPERAVLISAKEELGCTIPPAINGLLRVHKYVNNIQNDHSVMTSGAGRSIVTRLLVPDSQGRGLVGRQGATIEPIRVASGCPIRIFKPVDLPPFSLRGDSLVEIRGESARVHKAVELVALFLRKYLVDRSVVDIMEMEMKRSTPTPPPVAGPVIAPNHQYFVPYSPCDDYYYPPATSPHMYYPFHPDQPPAAGPPPAALPPMDNHLHEGPPPAALPSMENQIHLGPPPAYATDDASMGSHSSSAQPQQSVATKATQYMQIPISYAEAVIGAMGSNISYIRGTSGASITVRETKGMEGEMTVEITGTSSEIQAAQVLIQNFMAGDACATPNQVEEGTSSAWDHGHQDNI